MYDIIIIGGGPSGLTAGIYAGRAGKKTLIIEKNVFGGQMTFSPKIENYPGVSSGAGMEIAESMVDQVINQGVDTVFDTVGKVLKNADGSFTVIGEYGSYDGRSVIIATGCKHRKLGLEHEDEFMGNGVSFCAVCDGAFYKDRDVILIGGGNSALQEALLLSESCSHVTVVQNLGYFTGEQMLIDRLVKKDNVDAIFGCVADSLVCTDTEVKGIRIRNGSGEIRELKADGIFVAIGLQPENEPFRDLAPLNDYGYFDTDENCTTPTEGLFVAGDCRSKHIRQVTTANADGAVSALAACRYIDSLD